MNIKDVTELKERIDHHRPLVNDVTIAQKFRHAWTYHTNGIEGNTLREHFEVINHGEAIDYLQDALQERDFSEGLIKRLTCIVDKDLFLTATRLI